MCDLKGSLYSFSERCTLDKIILNSWLLCDCWILYRGNILMLISDVGHTTINLWEFSYANIDSNQPKFAGVAVVAQFIKIYLQWSTYVNRLRTLIYFMCVFCLPQNFYTNLAWSTANICFTCRICFKNPHVASLCFFIWIL